MPDQRAETKGTSVGERLCRGTTTQVDRLAHGFGLVLLSAGGLTSGCLATNLYATPRVVPEGETSHAFALEGFHAQGTCDPARSPCGAGRELLPTLPVYTGRRGIGGGVDLGLTVGPHAGVDLKWQFLRTTYLDVAIQPRVVGPWFAAHLPLLVGLRLGEQVTWMLTGGLAYTFDEVDWASWPMAERSPVKARGLALRLGSGLQVRLHRSFALHLEVSWLRFPTRDAVQTNVVSPGLAFQFGALP